MTTRRRVLALTTSGLAAVAGCAGDTGRSNGSETATPTDSDASSDQTNETATETRDVAQESDQSGDTDDLPRWTPSWTLETGYSHVLGVDAGQERLYLTVSSEDGPSAVAAIRYGEQTMAWEQSFEEEAEGGNPQMPDDHRDQWGVLVADETVYSVHGRSESYEWTTLHAVDAAAGDVRWSFKRECDLSVHAIRDGTVLATATEFFEPEHAHDTPDEPLRTMVYGLDESDGAERWTVSFEGVEDVAVGQETAVVAATDVVTGVGFDGTERWRAELSEPFRALATAGEMTVVATGDERHDTTLRGFGPGGSEQWTRAVTTTELFPYAGRVYAFGRTVTALEPDGTVAWQGSHGDEPTFSPGGDRLYTRSGRQGDAVDAYDLPAGEQRFRFDAPSNDAWPAAATDTVVAVEAITPDRADFTSLFAVSAETGAPTAVYRPGHNILDSEAVDGTVYVGFGDGTLAAFETDDW